uniref:Uncharacterized protein n=1 Tax=Triticum urartu TaxID=4572 RepID=A0A8R7PVJ0_TRIUA
MALTKGATSVFFREWEAMLEVVAMMGAISMLVSII